MGWSLTSEGRRRPDALHGLAGITVARLGTDRRDQSRHSRRRCLGGTPLRGVSLRLSGRTPPGSRKNFQTVGPPPFSGDHQITKHAGDIACVFAHVRRRGWMDGAGGRGHPSMKAGTWRWGAASLRPLSSPGMHDASIGDFAGGRAVWRMPHMPESARFGWDARTVGFCGSGRHRGWLRRGLWRPARPAPEACQSAPGACRPAPGACRSGRSVSTCEPAPEQHAPALGVQPTQSKRRGTAARRRGSSGSPRG